MKEPQNNFYISDCHGAEFGVIVEDEIEILICDQCKQYCKSVHPEDLTRPYEGSEEDLRRELGESGPGSPEGGCDE